MNVRALLDVRLLVLAVVGAVMVGMAWFGELFQPLLVGAGAVVGVAVAVAAALVPAVSESLDDVPPPLFAVIGVALAWGGAEYAPAIALSAFAGVAAGYALAAAGVAVADVAAAP